MPTSDTHNQCTPSTPPAAGRRDTTRSKRVQAADIAFNRAHPCHLNNCEEKDYPYVANYSKALQHDALGDVIPSSYQSMLNALQQRTPAAFEAIQLGPGGKKLTSPQAGLAFDLEGADTHAVTQPPAPRIGSAQVSSEMAELYWMALARDVHFSDYASSGVVQQAIQSLNGEFTSTSPARSTAPSPPRRSSAGSTRERRWARTSRSSCSRGPATPAPSPGRGAAPPTASSATARSRSTSGGRRWSPGWTTCSTSPGGWTCRTAWTSGGWTSSTCRPGASSATCATWRTSSTSTWWATRSSTPRGSSSRSPRGTSSTAPSARTWTASSRSTR